MVQLRLVDNPPNPYLSEHAEWLEPPPRARLEVYAERAKSILSKNDSPDLPYTWSVNPYRGCQHACAYCYARCTHEYLGFGAGTDFDTKLIAKRNAPELLDRALSRRAWKGEHLHFSGATDCYQPLEATEQLTRQCLEVCLARRNPACIVTKGALIVRDAELLAELHRVAGVQVVISIPFADAELARLVEPQASAPVRRFEAIRRLRSAGVPVGVFVSPVIPGLNDREIPAILARAAEAGANGASLTALRLPGNVEHVFVQRLREVLPLRAERVLARLRDIRGGRTNDTRFGARMRGQGVYWDSITQLFEVESKRHGLYAGCLSELPGAGGCRFAQPAVGPRAQATQLAFEFGE